MKRLLILGCIIAMILPFIVFSVSAADSNGNVFVDFNDYAEYIFSEDNSSVTVDVSFPSEWNNTYIDFGDTGLGASWYTGNTIYLDGVAGTWSRMRMYPITGNMNYNVDVGYSVTNSNILDLRYLPKGSTLTYEFAAGISLDKVDISDQVFCRYFFFVDSSGYIFARDRYYFYPESDGYGNYYWSETVNVSDFPEEAVGLVPHFLMRNIDSQFDKVLISLSSFKFTIPMSALEFQTSQNEQMKATMSNIQTALEDQGKQIEELPDKIGDQMQQVADNEKTEANSSGNSSVDQMVQIIPDYSTGLIQGIKVLANAISYEGTECKLTMPALTIPALKGVTTTPITFMEEQVVDLEVWFYRMPQEITAVVRALFDIAIVGFCFYELYDLISQVANGARKAEKVSK